MLEQQIAREQFPQDLHDRYLEHIKAFLVPNYVEFIGKEIQTSYLESYSEYVSLLERAQAPAIRRSSRPSP